MKKLMMIVAVMIILSIPVYADTQPQGEIWLAYEGMQVQGDNITVLIYKSTEGKIERFSYYDELSNYKQYVGSIAVYDYDSDMLAIYQDIGNFEWKCIFSDWD